MVSRFEQEMKVGAMIRSMSRDIKDGMKQKIELLYSDDNGNIDEPYRKSCALWHWNIVAYCKDEKIISDYTGLIEVAFVKKIDLNKSKEWKALMRRVLPIQFVKKVEGFASQVPQLAIMDDHINKAEEEEDWFE